MGSHRRGKLHLPLPVPPHHDERRYRRRLSALVLVVLLAGCTGPKEAELEPASIEGAIVVGDAFLLEEARLSVAPANVEAQGTAGRPVPLSEPPALGHTALARDHWVLEARLRERAPGAGAGEHRARLDWNGETAGEVYFAGANDTGRALGVVLRFDVGESIPPSNVYAFEITRMP